MTLVNYLEKEHGVLNFIELIWEWQDSFDDTCIKHIANIPKEYLQNYMKTDIIYRGMTIALGHVKNSKLCSWTKSVAEAKRFSEAPLNIRDAAGYSDTVYEVIYEKTDEFIDFEAIIEDLKRWMLKHNQYVDSYYPDENFDEILDSFYNEREVLSNFNVSNVRIYSLKPYADNDEWGEYNGTS